MRWLACHTQEEIAEAVGYSEKTIREFLDSLRNGENGTAAENPVSSENPELTNEVGFGQPAINEFVKNLQLIKNGTEAENDKLDENPELTNTDDREFDDEEQDDSNSLGVYKLDKRLLIKANHMDEYFKPPIYNVWKQQSKTAGVNHFGNSEVRWLACHTQEEIAEAVDMSEGAINEWIKDFLKISDDDKLRNPADFDVPIYNVWKQ